jgi:hypothetical protein
MSNNLIITILAAMLGEVLGKILTALDLLPTVVKDIVYLTLLAVATIIIICFSTRIMNK